MGEPLENSAPADGHTNFDLMLEPSEAKLGVYAYKILMGVKEHRFEEALRALKEYQYSRGEFPPFILKTKALYAIAEESINGIRAKMNVPNMNNMLQAKREELQASICENWETLKSVMKNLKGIEKEFQTADSRSTMWIVKAIMFSVIMIVSIFLINEALLLMGKSLRNVLDSLVKEFSTLF